MYIIVLICIFVNYHKIMQEGIILDYNSVALIMNSAVVFLYPVLVIALCFVPKETLLKDNVTERIGVMYEDLDLEKKGKIVLLHPIAGLARRIIFGLVLVFMTEYPLFQVYCLMIVCIVSIIVVAYVKPYPSPSENNWEIINETQVTITLYLLFGVTDIITDPYTKDQIGWAMITCTSITLSVCLLRAGLRSFIEFYRLIRNRI